MPVAMARYGAIFFNLNIISICLNYTSELGQDIVIFVLIFPIAAIHEVKCLVHGKELPVHSMSPLSVAVEQLIVWNLPFRIPYLHRLVFLKVAKLGHDALVGF